jgi:hypothetical protein
MRKKLLDKSFRISLEMGPERPDRRRKIEVVRVEELAGRYMVRDLNCVTVLAINETKGVLFFFRKARRP